MGPGAVLLLLLLHASDPQVLGPVAEGALAPADRCGSCHRDIYRTWRRSAHAGSMEGTAFLDSFHQAVEKRGVGVSRTCLGCHAPLAAVTDDWNLDRKITWEGVNCDACHSLVAVDLSGKGPRNVLEPGPVKRGPIRDASPVSHDVAYSELHTISLGCAGCHEYVNPEGTPVLTTFSEWKRSQAATDGVHCQHCHMAKVSAQVVDPRVKRVSHAEINLHDVPGGHSLDQLHKALRVTLEPRRSGAELILDVGLHNRGAGHSVPTGMPGRRVILEVTVRDSHGGSDGAERVFGKFFVDSDGEPIVRDADYFAPGVRLESDSCIQPDEHRALAFRFPIPRGAIGFVTLKLHYEHAPMGNEKNRTRITFYSEDRTVMPGSQSGS